MLSDCKTHLCQEIVMRASLLLFCLLLSSCSAMGISGGEGESLQAADGTYTLELPAGWSVKQQTQSPQGRLSILAHKDAFASGTGYPTVTVREIHEATPQGVLEIMARDKGLELGELWHVSPEKYQLKQALLDKNSQTLGYWLIPRDGQGVEYYGSIRLAGFGRIEMTGLAPAGKVSGYINDFNKIFTGLVLGEKARFTPVTSADTPGYLRSTYVQAVERERTGLKRQAEETAAWSAGPSKLSPQEKRFLEGAYATAVNKGLESAMDLAQALSRPRTRETALSVARLGERLDETATSLETIQLNIAEPQARGAVEKSAARARRLASLARETLKLPLE